MGLGIAKWPMCFLVLFLCFLDFNGVVETARVHFDRKIQLPSESEDVSGGTRWAVLIAGSSGFSNYRHQADVCHAYQILRRGGLKEENIVVFMYDDIAHNYRNPRPGTIINSPDGQDVYAGVPKDYTGRDVTTDNLFAVILGDKGSVKGGSGKVVDSGPNDHIFIFYSDHGGPGVLGQLKKARGLMSSWKPTNLANPHLQRPTRRISASLDVREVMLL